MIKLDEEKPTGDQQQQLNIDCVLPRFVENVGARAWQESWNVFQ